MVICLEWGADWHMPSWCHCHSLSLAPVKSRLVLPFWYRLTRVVPDKGPLNACVCVVFFLLCTAINFDFILVLLHYSNFFYNWRCFYIYMCICACIWLLIILILLYCYLMLCLIQLEMHVCLIYAIKFYLLTYKHDAFIYYITDLLHSAQKNHATNNNSRSYWNLIWSSTILALDTFIM